jgi:hypothetical protein
MYLMDDQFERAMLWEISLFYRHNDFGISVFCIVDLSHET